MALKVHETITRRWNHAREYWRPQNDMFGRLIAFCLDLEHYRLNEGLTKDRRRIQPRTQKQLNLIRHKASMLLRKLPEFDGHATQPTASSKAAEISRRVIENIFLDPLKAYHDVRSRFVWAALAGGRGNILIDWHPVHGVVFRFGDPRRCHIAPGHTFLHSPLTPFFQEEVPMRMSEVLKMKAAGWTVPEDLNPDDWDPGYSQGGQRNDGTVDFYGSGGPRPGADDSEEGDRIVTIVKHWSREDPFQRAVKAEMNADLPEDEWHHVDDSTGETQPFDPMNPVPPQGQSGNLMRLVTRKDERFDPGEREKGYLCIVAPFYAGKKALFEGGWTDGALAPDVTLASFPAMELTCYKNPLRRQGLSDAEATHSLVIVDNASYRATYEQMRQSGAIIVTSPGALKDSQGNQFQISDDPISIAYAEQMAIDAFKYHQLPGMNPAMPQFRQMVSDSWQAIGTGDFSSSLGPERSKDIAASTLSQLQESGDLPVQLHQQDLNLQESIGARVALDYCRAYMGDNVVSWVTDQGEAAYAMVRGADLVPLKVTVTAGKEWRQQDIDRVQGQAQFLGMISKMGLPPAAQIALLREAQFSDSVIEVISEEMKQSPPPNPALVTAQAAMVNAVANAVSKGAMSPNDIGPMLQDAGGDPQLIQAVMQALSQAPQSSGPDLSVVQGGQQQ